MSKMEVVLQIKELEGVMNQAQIDKLFDKLDEIITLLKVLSSSQDNKEAPEKINERIIIKETFPYPRPSCPNCSRFMKWFELKDFHIHGWMCDCPICDLQGMKVRT